MKKIMMLPCVLNSCAKWSGSMKPGALIAIRLLQAHQDRLDQRASQHHEGKHNIHDADLLVVEAGKPLAPQPAPSASVSVSSTATSTRANDHHRACARRR